MAYYKFCFGKQSWFRPLSKGGEGEAALKAAAASLPVQPQLPTACKRGPPPPPEFGGGREEGWSPEEGAGSRGQGTGFDFQKLNGAAPLPVGGSRATWGARVQ